MHDIHRILEKSKTNVAYYSLECLNDAIKIKHPDLARKSASHLDDAPAHTSSIKMPKLHTLRYELLPAFFLFSNMKKWQVGESFL